MKEQLQEIYEAAQESRPDAANPPEQGSPSAWIRRQEAIAGPKRQITARFDADLVESYQRLAGEGSYQRLMNHALREWLERQQLDQLLRRVLREELQADLLKGSKG